MRDRHFFKPFCRQFFRMPQRVFQRTQHQGERRAEFMADVGEKGGLGAIDLSQRFGAAAFLLVRLRVGDCRADLSGDQLHEAGIIVVEQPKRIKTGNQKAGAAGFATRQDRQYDGRIRRLLPGSARKSRLK